MVQWLLLCCLLLVTADQLVDVQIIKTVWAICKDVGLRCCLCMSLRCCRLRDLRSAQK